jgi:pilus assembly protein CpaB
MTARRRRGLLLLAVALASGGVAASRVHDRERRADEQLGPAVHVLVAARDVRAGDRVTREAVAVRSVPTRFVPPDALGSPRSVLGARATAPVPAGGYLTTAAFAEGGGQSGGGPILRRGERAVTVEVTSGGGVDELAPGARVDVLVSTESGAGGGRTTMALADAELLQIAANSAGAAQSSTDPSAAPTALATLRVTLRQAIALTEADNFAREIRLLPRPGGG